MDEKVKFELEYPVKASPSMLYPYLSTPSGLSEWFCDDVNSRGELFTFFWEDSEEVAQLLRKKQNQYIQFRWQNDVETDAKYYFEFRIVVDELTKDASLVITDFAEKDELNESKLLWQSQVNELLHTIGA